MYGINDIYLEYHTSPTKFRLIPIGDIHIGDKGCDIPRLRRLVGWIKNKENTYWIGMGDYANCINYTDKRFDPSTVSPEYLTDLDNVVSKQFDDLNKILSPIKDKCIGMHTGNHEETIRRKYHFDITRKFCDDWGVKYLGYSAFTRMHFKPNSTTRRHMVTIYSTHGAAGGRYPGYKINRLERIAGKFDADIILYAHSHTKDVHTTTQLRVTGHKYPRVAMRKQVVALTGCFMKGYIEGGTSYVERFDYPPTDLGVVKITIIVDKEGERSNGVRHRHCIDIHASV